jgi:hypothetical protein
VEADLPVNVEFGFKTSSFCSVGGCVEVGVHSDGKVRLRDSKIVNSAVLEFTSEEWDAFVLGVKNGEFDRAL